jgi:hypothetical protein
MKGVSPEIDTASSVSVFSNVSRRRLRPLVKGEPAVEFGRRRLHDLTGAEVDTTPWLNAAITSTVTPAEARVNNDPRLVVVLMMSSPDR